MIGALRSHLLLILTLFLPYSAWSAAQSSYSLADSNGVPLDHKIVKIMNFKNGVFIEVGAHDGITQSNTKLLEEVYEWTGVLIEPSPTLFEKLVANRPKSHCFQCALGSFEQDNTEVYGDFDGSLMASIDGKRLDRPSTQKVLLRSLQSILDELGLKHIHFFSLDTEGYELNILKGIDFTKTTFDYMLIELYHQEYEAVVSLLSNNGYILVENFSKYTAQINPGWDKTHNDYLFKRKDMHKQL